MDWSEITVKVDREYSDSAAAISNMAVPYGIYIEDYSDIEESAWEIAHIDLIDEELLKKDKNICLIHIYIPKEENSAIYKKYLKSSFSNAGIPCEITDATVNDDEWLNGWKKYFKPIEVGDKLVIKPSWEEYDNNTSRKEVVIDPGAAFGTGTHATTSLCLKLVERYLNAGDCVLDVGCGSGILSIAASLLGAKYALGIDIDETAVKIAKENAKINGIEKVTEYVCGDLCNKVSGKYELVCANIVADVIIRMLIDIDKYMKKDAVLIVSGIIDIRADDVKDAFSSSGYKIIEEMRKDNWYAFALKKGEE